MKALWSLFLILSPLAAHADPLLDHSAQLMGSIQQTLSYLNSHVADCTKYGSSIQTFMITPVSSDLSDFRTRLARFEESGPNACTSKADLDHMIASLNDKLAKTAQPQSQLMFMTPDQAVTKALTADSSHPHCAAHNPDDPTSTDQLKAYFALKTQLTQLKAVATSLKGETDCSR